MPPVEGWSHHEAARTMTNVEIMTKLTTIFRQVFYNDSIVLTPETTAADVPEWDSMTNITLVVEVEHAFGLKFKTAEIEGLSDVGALVALIRSRLSAVAA